MCKCGTTYTDLMHKDLEPDLQTGTSSLKELDTLVKKTIKMPYGKCRIQLFQSLTCWGLKVRITILHFFLNMFLQKSSSILEARHRVIVSTLNG